MKVEASRFFYSENREANQDVGMIMAREKAAPWPQVVVADWLGEANHQIPNWFFWEITEYHLTISFKLERGDPVQRK
jgi:hypothetical protein